jgi:30S ribosomal protein S31
MGKGDKRTRRGKISAGSFGKTRPKAKKKVAAAKKENKAETKNKE